MSIRVICAAVLCLALAVAASGQEPPGHDSDRFQSLSGPYLGQEPPGESPALFAPGIIPVDGVQHCVPAISPDGRAVYWMTVTMESDPPQGTIWFTQEVDGYWQAPKIAPFSGEYNDHAPVFSSDGGRLYYSSSRPGGVGRFRNIWYVSKTDTGWSAPVNLGSPPNSEVGTSQATFTQDGTMYFVGRYEGTQWNTAIYRSQFADGKYQDPELLDTLIRSVHADVYPFIAPDERYLLFGSTRPGGNSTETDLYISYRDSSGAWCKPIHLDESINNGKTVSFSRVSHDGRFLFFNRFDDDGTDKFYWVDASVLLAYEQHTGGESDSSSAP
jgi:hypothetical protein